MKEKDKAPADWKDPNTSGEDLSGTVCPEFTKAESAVVLALVRQGWQSILGSRSGFELLASVEDKMKTAGAVENSLPSMGQSRAGV